MAAVAANYDQFLELDAELLAISTDSVHTHKAWNDNELSKMVEGGCPFPMLSDPEGRIGKLYGVYDEEEMVNYRGVFIIDPDGDCQSISVLPPPVGRDIYEITRELMALQRVRETEEEEATPAGWQPGEDTLKPGPDLVGKVWEEWKPQGTDS
jgi:peroxiredoxin (alkyl hydroperoxide reductase subunit C)